MKTSSEAREAPRGWLDGRSPEELEDQMLFQQVREASVLYRTWQNRLNGLNFVVYIRGLVTRAGMKDIFEYGAKMAGMTRDKVSELIRIGNALEKAPILRRMFLRGEVGWSKIRTILTEVSPETDAFWATQVKRLPKQTLETLVRERKNQANPLGMSPGSPPSPALLMSPPSPPSTASAASAAPPVAAGVPDRTPSSGPDHPSPEVESTESPAHPERVGSSSGDGSLDRPTKSPTSKSLPGKARVRVDLDPILADKVSFIQGELSRREGRSFSFREALDRMVDAYQGEPGRPTKYLKVVVVDEEARRTYVRTTRGEVDVDPAELESERQAGDPIEIRPASGASLLPATQRPEGVIGSRSDHARRRRLASWEEQDQRSRRQRRRPRGAVTVSLR